MLVPDTNQMIALLHLTIVSLVRRNGRDLSARQLGVFLICYLQEGPHTVRGLAAVLNVSTPAISRALDRLGELELAQRMVDPTDRRSVVVQKTIKGQALLKDLRSIMSEVTKAIPAASPKAISAGALPGSPQRLLKTAKQHAG